VGLRCVIEGKEYEYDGKLTVGDAMFIFDKARIGVNDLNRALIAEGNPYALAAWLFLMKRRAGEAVRWEDMSKLDMASFNWLPDESADAEEPTSEGEPAAEENPTSTPGENQNDATPNT